MTGSDLDSDLIRQIMSGNESAMHELYRVYGQRLYAYALRLTNDPAQAEDVIQDALLIVWRTARRYRGEGKLLAWLLGIVHHTAIKSLRHKSIPLTDENEDSLPAFDNSPEMQAQTKEQADWIRDALDSLSPEHRSVLELVFYQGLSLEEIAGVMKCPLGTIKSRMNYARKHLRGILSRQKMEEWR